MAKRTIHTAVKPGDIILINSLGKNSTWYSKAQRFLTRKPYTHTAILLGDVCGTMSLLSANELVCVLPYKNYQGEAESGSEMEVYTFTHPPPIDMHHAILEKLYTKYAGTAYGFIQIFWFLYRWIMEGWFRRDVRRKRNPLTTGTVCSELVWYYLRDISYYYPELQAKVNEWQANTIHAGDIADICKSLPGIFKLIYTNKGDK